MAFNRDRNSRGGGGFRSGGRPGFESRGPVEMHKAICDKCRRECEVPFRPTQGKPVFCSNCFESQRGTEPGRNDRPANFTDRPMFEAVCDECGNSCKVPFQPSGDKPIYCSSCFGDKKNAGGKENGQPQVQYTDQFAALNQKLDKILQLLDTQPKKQIVEVEKKTKTVKKKSTKKVK